ncbi:MAG TPA: hypothetical protein VKV02_12645 [Acidobacteriaceae bacterium]|nr:hypothetical protein [Acidobacteriaceae bacterium]
MAAAAVVSRHEKAGDPLISWVGCGQVGHLSGEPLVLTKPHLGLQARDKRDLMLLPQRMPTSFEPPAVGDWRAVQIGKGPITWVSSHATGP